MAAAGHLLGGDYFRNKDGLYIHYRSWSSPSARASNHVVVLVHGRQVTFGAGYGF